jgi:hypothetical protein
VRVKNRGFCRLSHRDALRGGLYHFPVHHCFSGAGRDLCARRGSIISNAAD